MAMTNSAFADIDLNQVEYCRTVGDQPVNADTYRVQIPKLMLRTFEGRVLINRSMFINCKDCPVQSKSSINVANYITIKRASTCNLNNVSVNNCIPNNTLLMCACVTNNINDLIIISGVN